MLIRAVGPVEVERDREVVSVGATQRRRLGAHRDRMGSVPDDLRDALFAVTDQAANG